MKDSDGETSSIRKTAIYPARVERSSFPISCVFFSEKMRSLLWFSGGWDNVMSSSILRVDYYIDFGVGLRAFGVEPYYPRFYNYRPIEFVCNLTNQPLNGILVIRIYILRFLLSIVSGKFFFSLLPSKPRIWVGEEVVERLSPPGILPYEVEKSLPFMKVSLILFVGIWAYFFWLVLLVLDVGFRSCPRGLSSKKGLELLFHEQDSFSPQYLSVYRLLLTQAAVLLRM